MVEVAIVDIASVKAVGVAVIEPVPMMVGAVTDRAISVKGLIEVTAWVLI